MRRGQVHGSETERHWSEIRESFCRTIDGIIRLRYPPEWELYDLRKDPDELRSVYHDPEYAEIRDELKRKLWQAQAAVGDNPHPSQPVPDGVDA